MIDWDFIASLEGMSLKGSVPDPEHSQSGVTVASGVDLGQISSTLVVALPNDLRALLTPYVGLKQQAAVDYLSAHPLTLTQSQADLLEQTVRTGALRSIASAYFSATGKSFDTLPAPLQTVVASVAFQYGSLAAKTPHFWKTVIGGNIHAVIAELKHFGDRYPTRRNKEADYLAAHSS